MKKLIFFSSLCLINSIVAAQAVDTKAKAILDEVSAKTKAYKTMSIDFTYTMENKTRNINQSKKGTVLIKGDKYRMTMAGQTIIYDGSAIYTFIKEANEIQINEPTEENINPTQLLTSYNEDYKSKFIKEETSGGVVYQIIDLTPSKQSKAISRVRVKINKAKKQITSSTLYDKDGTTYTYNVDKFVADSPISDVQFVFNKSNFPGAEIIDMR